MQSKVQAQLVISSKPMLALAFLIASILTTTSTLMARTSVTPPMAQETITRLITKELAGPSGQQALMYTVDFPLGFWSPSTVTIQVFVYVLAGSVVMQLRGQKALTLGPGQSFYENPDDIHVVSRNASSTKPAQFLVFMIQKKGHRWCYQQSNNDGRGLKTVAVEFVPSQSIDTPNRLKRRRSQ